LPAAPTPKTLLPLSLKPAFPPSTPIQN
jgi:hypothetical protein